MKRKLFYSSLLVLALSADVMFTACTPNIEDHLLKIAAQKEAEEKEGCARSWAFGKQSLVVIQKKGEIQSVYPTTRDTFQAI